MTTRRDFLRMGGLGIAALAANGSKLFAQNKSAKPAVLPSAQNMASNRPAMPQRKFVSKAVEAAISETKAKIQDQKLAWMFENCFPNTLDTTVTHTTSGGKPDTFVITGDIPAMWLRDSSAQVFPYLPLAAKDTELKNMLAGLIRRQMQCVLLDPYANAFNDGAKPNGEWQKDRTRMLPELHERKWEVDSLCYVIRLAYNYWKITGDAAPFDEQAYNAAQRIYQTFVEQQRKQGLGPYRFQRRTERASDTMLNDGWGSPVKPVGMIYSAFRPSDDATAFGFLIPSNLFAVVSLRQLSEMMSALAADDIFAGKCRMLADEIETAVRTYGIVQHKTYGEVYAYEVDGYGSQLLMDDANVPSLLSLPYLGYCKASDPIYQNTRRMLLSMDNPYFFAGRAGEGIGGPHIGYDYVWHMSIIMRAFTSEDDAEIRSCIEMLRNTDGGTGFMHESFHKDDASKFTRKWFAWANTLFGELIVKTLQQGMKL